MSIDKRRVLLPEIIGSILEWYNYALFGFFAPVFARIFFPNMSYQAALIATFGIFAAGFIMRPLGALLFSYLVERHGRKMALSFSIILLTIPTALMGFLPSYEMLGVYAAVLLAIFRLLQGLAMGGEFTRLFVDIIEQAPVRRRGFYGSWTMAGATGGLLLGSTVSALVIYLTLGTTAEPWAWRIPFIAGLLFGFISVYVRWSVFDDESLTTASPPPPCDETDEPAKPAGSHLLQGIAIMAIVPVSFYLFFVYLVTYMYVRLDMPLYQALMINSFSMLILVFAIPVCGFFSDTLGRRPILFFGTFGLILLPYPMFTLLQHADAGQIFIAQAVAAILTASVLGAAPATLVEMFPTKTRYTALSMTYNIPQTIFGGTTPLIAAFFIAQTHDLLSPSYYLIAMSTIAFLASLFIPETYKKCLHDKPKIKSENT